jgi:hypothetical protein
MVEDCGGDNSWQIIQALAQQDARVKGIQISRVFSSNRELKCTLTYFLPLKM